MRIASPISTVYYWSNTQGCSQMVTVYETLHFSAQAFEESLKFLCLHIYQKSCTGCYPHFIYLKLSQNIFAYSGLRYLFQVLALKMRGNWLLSVYFDILRVSILQWKPDSRITLIGRTTLTTASDLKVLNSRIQKCNFCSCPMLFPLWMNIYKFAITQYNP